MESRISELLTNIDSGSFALTSVLPQLVHLRSMFLNRSFLFCLRLRRLDPFAPSPSDLLSSCVCRSATTVSLDPANSLGASDPSSAESFSVFPN
jgi:hypothetical protein